jgi:hypothetical protein
MSNARAFGMLSTAAWEEPEVGFIEQLPEGPGLATADAMKPCRGERAADVYPADARVHLAEDRRARKLADFQNNNRALLIVSRRVKDIFVRLNSGETEYLPLAVHDAKKKLASRDYFIVNPIGTYDVVDPARSSKHAWKLDPNKTATAPELFRPSQQPTGYIISKNIATELRGLDPKVTNLHYTALWNLDDDD